MSIQEKLQIKLKPHTDKLLNNQADDFDYLPAVLDYLIQEYKNQKQVIANLNADNQALKADVTSLVSSMKQVENNQNSSTKMLKWIIALTLLIIVLIAVFVFFMVR